MSAPMRRGSYNVYRKLSTFSHIFSIGRVIGNENVATKHAVEYKLNKKLLRARVGATIDNKQFLTHFCDRISAHQSFHTNSTANQFTVLGIETSCDDTGAAVVDDVGNILGDELKSQHRLHVQFGGILPMVARDLHREHIASVVENALEKSGKSLSNIDAIATSVMPGLPMCLTVGLEYSKKLIKQFSKPFIPVHHMEAHALTARMLEHIEMPFLVLLISGGHCLLAVVRNVDDFLLIGRSTDVAPGDVFDKVSRRLKLKNRAEYADVSGGQAIELSAKSGDPRPFALTNSLNQQQDCNFTFSGLYSHFNRVIEKQEELHGIKGGATLPNVSDVCASFQYSILHHLAKRVQRAILFCQFNELVNQTCPTLVVSGGVASNAFIREGLDKICSRYDWRVVCPPPNLCTDNGIMVAWNGIEKLKKGIGVVDIDTVKVEHRSPLGEDWTHRVAKSHIKLKSFKLLD